MCLLKGVHNVLLNVRNVRNASFGVLVEFNLQRVSNFVNILKGITFYFFSHCVKHTRARHNVKFRRSNFEFIISEVLLIKVS